MNCPVCGAEVNGDVCTTCGARVSGTSSFSLQGNVNVGATPTYNNIQQPAADDFSDLETPTYNVGMGGNMNGGMNTYPSYSTPASKKSKTGVIAGIIVAVIVLAVAGVVVFNMLMSKKAINECEKLIDTFMTGLEQGDPSKLSSIVDPDATGGADAETMEQIASMMSLVLALGAELDIDYTIVDREKASSSTIKEMCIDLYDDSGMAKKIGRAYYFEVEATMTVSFFGESQSDTQTMYMLCYEKGGNYYVWTEDTDLGDLY